MKRVRGEKEQGYKPRHDFVCSGGVNTMPDAYVLAQGYFGREKRIGDKRRKSELVQHPIMG